MVHRLETSQWLPAPVETVFAFFADPGNLPRLMPAWQRAEIAESRLVPPPNPAPFSGDPVRAEGSHWRGAVSAAPIHAAGPGSRMLIRFRALPLLPIRLSWMAKITDFGWNSHFCDEQVYGPFAYWRHCHRIGAQTRNGVPGTLIRDQLAYELPFGWLGEAAHVLFARRQIAAIFRHRQKMLEELLG